MIDHKEAQEILTKAVQHLGSKLDLEDQCPECGCSPINATEIALLFKYLGQIEGVEGVAAPTQAEPTKPSGSVAFPVRKAGGDRA